MNSYLLLFIYKKIQMLRTQRLRILRKIAHWLQIEYILQTKNIRKGANWYAIQYLQSHLDKYVRIKHVIDYCNQQTIQSTGRSLSDPKRSFQKLRSHFLANQWSEIQYKQIKYVKFTPYKKIDCTKTNNKTKTKPIIETIIETKTITETTKTETTKTETTKTEIESNKKGLF
jgi:hypothetical protein